MDVFDETPDTWLEKAQMLENMLVGRATGDLSGSNDVYADLRRAFMEAPELKPLLPSFVRTCRSLETFWAYIKGQAGTYVERRGIIGEAFTPLVDHLEGANSAPSDSVVADVAFQFDVEGVHAQWTKAVERRKKDPEGAITSARTLLETVCKRILDELQVDYSDKEDLPKLYGKTAAALKLAPSQHTETEFKTILGGCQTVVNGLGTLRNKLSDAHGRGGKAVKPADRHANLAVNLAGAMATFLIETFEVRK